MTTEGYVYLIQCVDTTYYKIGITRQNVEDRVKALQTGSPHELKLVMMFLSKNAEEAEAWVHKALAQHRRRGEWFDLKEQGFCDFVLAMMPGLPEYVKTSSIPMMVGYVPPTE